MTETVVTQVQKQPFKIKCDFCSSFYTTKNFVKRARD